MSLPKFSHISQALQYLSDLEGKRIVIAATLEKMLPKLTQNHGIEEQTILDIAEGDPTYKGDPKTSQSKNINTLIEWYKNNNNKLDIQNTKKAIKEFNEKRGQGKLPKDSKLPESFEELEEMLKDDGDLVLHADDKFKNLKQIDSSGQYRLFKIDEKWTEDNPFTVFKNKHPWCVHDEGEFNNHIPMYLFTKGNDFYALLSDKQFHKKQAGQEPVDIEYFKPIKELAIKNGLKEAILKTDVEDELIYDLMAIEEIAQNPKYAYYYARDVLEGPFPKGEKAIATNPYYAYEYAKNILEERFLEGEKEIADDPKHAYYYAVNVLKYYAVNVPKGRFPEGERAIATSPEYSYYYAKNILEERFLEGEKAIASSTYFYFYARHFNLIYDKESRTFKEKESVKAFNSKSEAIQYLSDLEGKRIVIAAKTLKQRLPQLQSSSGLDEKDILELAKADPTNNGDVSKPSKYIDQIIEYNKKDKNLKPEELKELIQKFIDDKGDNKSLPGDLQKLRKTLDISDTTPAKFKGKGVKELDSSGQYKLFLVNGEHEDTPFAKYPNDHPWCIKQESFYDEYKPIYLFTKGSDFYAVLAVGAKQFNDKSNDATRGISLENFKLIKKLAFNNGLKDKIEKTNAWDTLKFDFLTTEEISEKPEDAYHYAVEALKMKNVPDMILNSIAKTESFAYTYAYYELKGENVPEIIINSIAKDPYYAKKYAKEYHLNYNEENKTFKKNSIEEIAKDPITAYNYANDVLKGKNVPDIILNSIAKNPLHAQIYAREVLKGENVPEVILKSIAKNPEDAYNYSREFLKGKNIPDILIKGMAQDPHYAFNFALNILEGENVPEIITNSINKDPEKAKKYTSYLKYREKEAVTAFNSKSEALQYLSDLEGKRIVIAATLEKMLPKLTQNHGIEEQTILDIAEGDPTYKGDPKTSQSKNINTLIEWYKKNDNKLDVQNTKKAIKEFNEKRGQGKLPKDSKLPESFEELEEMLKDDGGMVLHADDKFKNLKQIGSSGQYRLFKITEKWTEDNPFTVFKNKHPWCVHDESEFNNYTPMYLFTKGNDFYALLSDKQFHKKQAGQEPVDIEYFKPIKELAITNGLKEAILKTDAKDLKYDLMTIEEITTNSQNAYNYAKDILKGPFPEGEKAIATNAHYSYYYAKDILKGPFPEGEKAIATNSQNAYYYAKNILKGPFPEGEKAIATSPDYAYNYAKDILKGPFPEGEKAIATYAEKAFLYAFDFFKGKDVPDIILNKIPQDPKYAYLYAENILKERFLEGEKAIATSSHYSYYYAVNVLEGRFPEGEKEIATSTKTAYRYAEHFNLIYGKENETFKEKESVKAFNSKSEAIQYLSDLEGKRIVIATKEEDDEYFEALRTYYKDDPEIIDIIKMGESAAQEGFNSNIITERSDSGNVLIRYIESGSSLAIVGMINKKGRLGRNDVNSLKSWINRLLNKIQSGHKVYASTNKFSRPILDRVIKMAKEQGMEIEVSTEGSHTFGNQTWDNMIISKN